MTCFRKCLHILLLLLISCFYAHAQQKIVNGVVRDAETREPLAGVSVGI